MLLNYRFHCKESQLWHTHNKLFLDKTPTLRHCLVGGSHQCAENGRGWTLASEYLQYLTIYAHSRVSVRGWEQWTLCALADTESTRVSGPFLPHGISGSGISFFQALAKSSLSLVVVFARIWKKLPLSIEQKLR